MDISTGRIYDSKLAALCDGASESDLAEFDPAKPDEVVVTKGPFKGRTYRWNELGQLERVREKV